MWSLINQDGVSALDFASIISLDVKQEATVVSAAIEAGSFTSYNKNNKATVITLEVGFNGQPQDFATALETLTELKSTAALVNLVTPSAYYESFTISILGYKREPEKGCYCVNLTLNEILQVSDHNDSEDYSERRVRNTDSAASRHTGKTQPRHSANIENRGVRNMLEDKEKHDGIDNSRSRHTSAGV